MTGVMGQDTPAAQACSAHCSQCLRSPLFTCAGQEAATCN